MTRRVLALSTFAAVLLAAVVWTASSGEAHKAITSKYHFNEDVFPMVRDRCGRCHVDGGVAPMSLMTYDDAAPWAESIRIELLNEETPPWHPLELTARELDLLLVWATGGAPRGKIENAPPSVPLVNEWGSGAPDVTLAMREPFVLPGAVNEATHEVVLPLSGAKGKSLAAIDLLPGTPAMVRSATLLLKTAAGTRELAEWQPGQGASVPLATPVAVSDGAAIVARVVYKRTWKYESQDLKDLSAIGLYFGSAQEAHRHQDAGAAALSAPRRREPPSRHRPAQQPEVVVTAPQRFPRPRAPAAARSRGRRNQTTAASAGATIAVSVATAHKLWRQKFASQ